MTDDRDLERWLEEHPILHLRPLLPLAPNEARHVTDPYVERFWSPHLGPSIPAWLRLCDRGFIECPAGFVMSIEKLSEHLGMPSKGKQGRRRPMGHTIARAVHYGLAACDTAQESSPTLVEVRTMLPRVPHRRNSKVAHLFPEGAEARCWNEGVC